MKKIMFFLLISLLFYQTTMAHPGRVDKNGGHHKTSDGTYHYHLGSDRSVEFEHPPSGDEVIPTPTPKATKTPKPSEASPPKPTNTKEPEVSKEPDNQKYDTTEESEPVTTNNDVSISPSPDTQQDILPVYETEEEQPLPVKLPVSRSVFIILFSIVGVITLAIVSFLIFLLDRRF